jgi:hypothetical protein
VAGVVERYLDAIIGHDWDSLAASLADDGFVRVGPWGDEYAGKAEYVAFIADPCRGFPATRCGSTE